MITKRRKLLFFSKNEHHIVYRKRPPRIVNWTAPKIIAISIHTVNRFPLRSTAIRASMITLTQPMRFVQLEVTTSPICYIALVVILYRNKCFLDCWTVSANVLCTLCLSCSMWKYMQTAMHWNLPSKWDTISSYNPNL
jgi:hypothetical protein